MRWTKEGKKDDPTIWQRQAQKKAASKPETNVIFLSWQCTWWNNRIPARNSHKSPSKHTHSSSRRLRLTINQRPLIFRRSRWWSLLGAWGWVEKKNQTWIECVQEPESGILRRSARPSRNVDHLACVDGPEGSWWGRNGGSWDTYRPAVESRWSQSRCRGWSGRKREEEGLEACKSEGRGCRSDGKAVLRLLARCGAWTWACVCQGVFSLRNWPVAMRLVFWDAEDRTGGPAPAGTAG